MLRPGSTFPASVAAFCLLTLSSVAQEAWTQFRGPGARGVGTSDRLPLVWGTDTNVAWRVDVPGRGWSSPIVSGGRVFLTSALSADTMEVPKPGLYFGGERPEPSRAGHRWVVTCLDLETGETRWTTEVHSGPPATPIHVKNTYASETPVTDGEHVFAYFGSLGLFCLDNSGKTIWSRRFEPLKMRNGWGTSASPVLHGDRVYVVNDNEQSSFTAAFDKRTGEELWRVSREEPSNFATPFVWENDRRTELVVPGRNQVRSYDLDGRLLWQFKGLSTITIPTPFAAHGLVYLAGGYVGDNERPNKPIYAIRPGATGDLTLAEGEKRSEYVAWMEPNAAPYNPSPLAYGDRLYVLWDFGFLNCRDARTGRELYEKQRLKPDGTAAFTSSPWAYRGRIFCLSEAGDTYVIKDGASYELERVNSLDEMCLATPALSGDRLLIRTIARLYCVREAK